MSFTRSGSKTIKKKFILFVYLAVVLPIIMYSSSNLLEVKTLVFPEVCCSYSSDCPGTMLCYSNNPSECCDEFDPSCLGAKYCRYSGAPEGD
jgi:hypothetical protein